MPKWFVYCTLAMLTFAVWTLVTRVAMNGLSPYAATIVTSAGEGSSEGGAPPDDNELKRLAEKEAAYLMQTISAFGLIPFAVPLLFSSKLRRGTNFPRGIVFAICCGVFSAVGNLLLYLAIAERGPLSLVCPITAMPLIPVILAPFLFKERISVSQAVGIGCAVVAITLLNTDPGSKIAGAKLFAPWMLFSLLALLSYGVAMTTQKAATYHISDELSTVVYTVAFLAVAGYLVAVDPSLVAMLELIIRDCRPVVVTIETDPVTVFKVLPILGLATSLFIGLLMGFGTLMLYAAYRWGKAAVVTPYSLMYPLITVLVAVPAFGDQIDWLRGVGIAFALIACVLLAIEKSQPVAAPVTEKAFESATG